MERLIHLELTRNKGLTLTRADAKLYEEQQQGKLRGEGPYRLLSGQPFPYW